MRLHTLQRSLRETYSTFGRVFELLSIIRPLARTNAAQIARRLHAATQRTSFFQRFQWVDYCTDLHAGEIGILPAAQNCTGRESLDSECPPSEMTAELRPHGPVITRPCGRDLKPYRWQTPEMHRHVKESSMSCHRLVRTVAQRRIRPGEARAKGLRHRPQWARVSSSRRRWTMDRVQNSSLALAPGADAIDRIGVSANRPFARR